MKSRRTLQLYSRNPRNPFTVAPRLASIGWYYFLCRIRQYNVILSISVVIGFFMLAMAKGFRVGVGESIGSFSIQSCQASIFSRNILVMGVSISKIPGTLFLWANHRLFTHSNAVFKRIIRMRSLMRGSLSIRNELLSNRFWIRGTRNWSLDTWY
jgi:hypothetical protein